MFQCGEKKKISQHQGPGVPEQEREGPFLFRDSSHHKTPAGRILRLILELKLCHDRFHTYFRMSVTQFELLLTALGTEKSFQRAACF